MVARIAGHIYTSGTQAVLEYASKTASIKLSTTSALDPNYANPAKAAFPERGTHAYKRAITTKQLLRFHTFVNKNMSQSDRQISNARNPRRQVLELADKVVGMCSKIMLRSQVSRR